MQTLHMIMDSTNTRPQWRATLETAPTCPRCASPNTKFCYYNNYSFSQPRYFCKGCRRYWTKGGSLRNVPVGGGCRKNRRLKAATRAAVTHPSPSSDSSSNDPDSLQHGGNNSGVSAAEPSNIDLAVIFANYLNQNSGEASPSSGHTASASDTSTPELPHVRLEGNSHDFAGESHELQGFELQGLLGGNDNDEKLGEDMTWYDDASWDHSTWQCMLQLQEIQAVLLDDQTKLTSDGWSSFDLSTS